MIEVKCKVCDTGVLHNIKRYRMSGVVVVIGYLLLVPSVLGIVSTVLFQIAIVVGSVLGSSETKGSTAYATLMPNAAVGIFSMVLGFSFLVAGLLGWLLVMKKKILQCNYCGAVVAAS